MSVRTVAVSIGRVRAVRALRASRLPLLYFAGLSVLIFRPVLEPGYVLSLDMIFGPHPRYLDFLLHSKGPLYYGRLPVTVLLDGLVVLFPGWVVQKGLLLALPVTCGLAAYSACDGVGRPAAFFAGTLYAVNPFVYVRLLAGHWWFLLGYAVLPLAVVWAYRHLDSRAESDGTLARAVVWATVVSVFDPHATVLLGVAGGCLTIVLLGSAVRARDRLRTVAVTRRFAGYVAACAVMNAFWLVPAVAALRQTRLGAISGADLTVFAPHGTLAGNVELSVAMLYGFWRPGYLTTADLLSLGATVALFAVLLYLFVTGAVRGFDDPLVAGLVLAAGLGFVLALGVSTAWSARPTAVLFESVPVLRGMRDTQKFAGLLALAYALVGARGVDSALCALGQRFDGGALPTVPLLERRGYSTRQVAVVAASVLVLAVPLAAAAPMVAGFAGQLDSTTYPDDWEAADAALAADPGPHRVLVLPWQQYLEYPWTEGTVATPADLYFRHRTVVSHTIAVGGIETRATDPTRRATRAAIDAFRAEDVDAAGFGARLAPLGVKYVLVTHGDASGWPAALAADQTFDVVFSQGTVTILENAAYETAPESTWPRAGPPVPLGALGVGAIVSLCGGWLSVRRRPR